MKKVLVFTTAFTPHASGAELAIEHIARRLAGNFEFFVVTMRFSQAHPRFEEKGNIKIFRIGNASRFYKLFIFPWAAFFHGKRITAAHKIDVIWGVMVTYATIGGYFLKLRYPDVPLLLTLQEGDPETYLTRGRLGLLGFWWKRLVKKADYIQAISNYLADLASKQGARCPVVVIPNGVEENFFEQKELSKDLEKYRTFLNLKPEDFVLISASRLVKKNGLDVIIAALQDLPPTVKLIIAGEGELGLNLRRMTKSLGLEDRVRFLGNIDHLELVNYLRLSSVFVRPSRSEGLGSAFLEAMASGLPVIATQVGGIPEFLEHEKNGLFVSLDDPHDLAEKIKRLASDRDLLSRLSTGAFRTAAGYRWSGVAESFNKLFNELTDAKS